MHQDRKRSGWASITPDQIFKLFSVKANPEGAAKAALIFLGLFLSPITLFGALWFYMRGYDRFMRPNSEMPRFANMPPIVKLGMAIGAVLAWVIVYFSIKVMVFAVLSFGGRFLQRSPYLTVAILLMNVFFTYVVFFLFNKWKRSVKKSMIEGSRYGTARFAEANELAPYMKEKGFYIGKNLFYGKPGHLLTVAGTRAGKFVNLLSYILLRPYLFKGSIILVDPKAENAAVSGRIQKHFGRKVVYLNPFDLLSLGSMGFNPLDILKNDINLSDDVLMFAESIVEQSTGENKHFQDRARAFVATFLLHIMTACKQEDRHLGTLWSMLRSGPQEFIELLADMSTNNDPNFGDIVKAGANEIISMLKNSEREFGSVMSNAFEATGFIQSPALRDSLKGKDGFSADDLASGNVTVYLCIPFEKISSHKAWLRLVVTALMRSVVRDPKTEAAFIIDEANAFGFHSEILTGMSAYAGMGVHIWSIFQDLSQIKNIYGDNWQTFIANSSVRHFFNISDNFSAEYLEKMFGATSILSHNDKDELTGSTARPLITADEIRRESGDIMYTVIDQLPVARIPKHPYYKTDLDCDPNPYFKGEAQNRKEVIQRPEKLTREMIRKMNEPPPPPEPETEETDDIPPMPPLAPEEED
ncbi:type IV secretory system conjugative DNA transfer family protein [Flavitalea sp. BT771]|uniref:type IV secretory system conjugative DNA transfer family protein n=1 Tax=Flavitalea sp. BT771 TaxID=3063329 RepID=UPI0026E22809|nr:type IV secretory system conjugative DNA transfer family protein [Flavitalea sp. BT771]MDO6430915.1 type IV secretory system conjugative DNA transfer family protein [Flavitalea sp. BT771]MDV6218945.1 type IV secretory system conjugative DNA transfer family protein [Flavitalea sp. BT771]